MKHPRISIVLPSYNGSRWLGEAIESVIRQSEQEWELIIVDDCSADATLEISRRYEREDPRIRVISNETNKKLPGSLNRGFSLARGRYRTWTSDDNLYKPDALAVMSRHLDAHPATDLVSANMDCISETGEFVRSTRNQDCTPLQLAYRNNIGAAFMYRSSTAAKVGEYDESAFCAEDYDYWCRIALSGRIDYIPDNLYSYRDNSQSLTATREAQVMEMTRYIQNKHKQDFIEKFHLNWWQKRKLAYLVDTSASEAGFSLPVARNRCVHLILACLFFWNAKLRREFRERLRITL